MPISVASESAKFMFNVVENGSRSTRNVRMERGWRDIRKDCIEVFRQIFFYLERLSLLDMGNDIHRLCLFLTFQWRIQISLNRALDAWNHHKIRTDHNRSPVVLYELSREQAINRGYWTGDAGDPLEEVQNNPRYGVDSSSTFTGDNQDSEGQREDIPLDIDLDTQRERGLLLNKDDEIEEVQALMRDFDFDRDDGNWGIEVYCEAVVTLTAKLQ